MRPPLHQKIGSSPKYLVPQPIQTRQCTQKDTNDELLYSYDWPGNVRELRNLVERISILSKNENKANIGRFLNEILSKNSSDGLQDPGVSLSFPLKQARENFEKSYLLNQLKKNKGNVSKTAEFIGMERSALHRKLKSLGIKGIN